MKVEEAKQPLVSLPDGKKRLLLHSCCAVCCGNMMQRLCSANIDYEVVFYNPNIYPEVEYNKRKDAIVAYCEKMGIKFTDLGYEVDDWYRRVNGLEKEPEKGRRCTVCFEMRLEKVAKYAHENGFDVFVSSLGASRWKDIHLVNEIGCKIAQQYDGLSYWEYDWRKKRGTELLAKVAKEEGFYMQEFCGCEYSLNARNKIREKQGLAPIYFKER
jgi:predicted adenine nucleotide alpha hydrolase (AANH) superfamily ATPase